jgi:hypothetical protein
MRLNPVFNTLFLATVVVFSAVSCGLTTPMVTAAAPATSVPTVQTRVAYVSETRALIFANDKQPYVQSLSGKTGLTVCLQVVGKLLRRPNFYHHVHIITEVLNTGHTLTPLAPRFQQIVPVDSPLYHNMQQAGEVGFPIALRFAAPSPKAASIRELIGSVDVAAGGRVRGITLANPLSLIGRHIADAGLQAAHIRLRIINMLKARHSRFLIVEMIAPAGVFQSMAVLQHGKIISGGYIIAQLPKGIDKLMIPLTARPGAAAVLQIKALTGWHEYRIPFTLNNIPLPGAPVPPPLHR